MQKKVRESKRDAKFQGRILFGDILRGARCQLIGFEKTAHVSQRIQRRRLVDDLRVLLVESAFATLLQIDVEDVVVALTSDNHDLWTVVVKRDHVPYGTRGRAVG
jgi:hypothetical protein